MTAFATGRMAITTKFLGPTNHRGSRVVASCEAGRLTVSWDHDLNTNDNHAAACEALAAKLGWSGDWLGGGTGGGGYSFVLTEGRSGYAFTDGRGPAK